MFKHLKDWQPKLISTLKKGYSFSYFQRDLIAGLSVAIVAFPLAMALGVASKATPHQGLMTAIIAGFVISMLGGGRTQIGGPSAAFIVVVVGIIDHHGYSALLGATFIAGCLLVIAGLARLGAIIRYIPYSVIAGFTSGLAIVILANQVTYFFGIDISSLPSEFITKCLVLAHHLKEYDGPTTFIGLLTVFLMFMIRRSFPKVPVLLFVVIVTSFLVWAADIPVDTLGSKFGSISAEIPSPQWPLSSFDSIFELLPAATTIAFLAGVEALLCATIADGLTGDSHRSNAELIAQGVTNILIPFWGAIPGAAAFSRTATNIKAGAKTPIAGIIHAIALLAFMYLLSSWVGLIPLATLAGILVVIGIDMMELRRFYRTLKGPKGDALLIVVTFVLTLLANLTVAIQGGIILAALLFVQRMSRLTQIRPQEARLSENGKEGVVHSSEEDNGTEVDLPKGVHLYYIQGPFFFGAASRLRAVLEQIESTTKIYILNLSQVPLIDGTGAQVINHFMEGCHKRGTTVILCGLNSHSLDILSTYGGEGWPQKSLRVTTVQQAITLAKALLNEPTTPVVRFDTSG